MGLASNASLIRFKGTGRAYYGEVAGSSYYDSGELQNLDFGVEQPVTQIESTRNASKAVILEATEKLVPSITFGMREWSDENLKNCLLSSTINTLNQAAGTVDADEIGAAADVALVSDMFIDLGHLNLFSTKLTGVITGTIAVGDTITGVTSSAHGDIAYKSATTVELINVVGTFQAGETVQLTSGNNIVPSGIEILKDVIITNAAGTVRRVQGTDYTLDPDYGLIRKLSSPGAIIDTDLISYDYEAVNKKYMWGGNAGIVNKKLMVVTDKNDLGPRTRWTFHKISFVLSGSIPIIGGDGVSVLPVNGTVLWDATQPSGQEYYKTEIIG